MTESDQANETSEDNNVGVGETLENPQAGQDSTVVPAGASEESGYTEKQEAYMPTKEDGCKRYMISASIGKNSAEKILIRDAFFAGWEASL